MGSASVTPLATTLNLRSRMSCMCVPCVKPFVAFARPSPASSAPVLLTNALCAPRSVIAPFLLYLQRVVERPPVNTYPVARRFGTAPALCSLCSRRAYALRRIYSFSRLSHVPTPLLHNAVLALLLPQPTYPKQHQVAFCYPLPLSRRFYTMSSFVSPLLTGIKHRMADDPYAADLHSRWTEQSTPELLQAAQATLPTLGSHPPSGVNDALRWSLYKGKISSVSSIGAMLHPQGLLLTCQAKVQTSSDKLIAAHVPLAIAAGPKILGYLPLPSDDMARRLVEKWNPSHKPLDRPKMHASIARMLGVQDSTQVRGVPNTALKAKLIRPIGDHLPAGEVRNFWVRLPPANALSVLWEQP